MIRGLLMLVIFMVIYSAIKTVIRSALKAYHREDNTRTQLKGEEMVLDPECRTYVIKDRAVSRRIRGTSYSFCSEACARQYEQKIGN